uniref:Ig-like domain-containing protein n=1 Tax=Terrapene triunguis TaxID=2587831 RepID=A0A674IB94_9SAUR
DTICVTPTSACLFVHPEGSLPKPSISVSPGGVIPVGGNVIIRCRHQRLDLRFLLYKDEDENYLTYTDPAGSEAEFRITSARWEQSGNYTCRYSNRTGPAAYSEPSDPVQIIVAGEGPSPAPRLPAPHPARPRGISLSPGTQWMGRPASEGWVCRGDLSPLEVGVWGGGRSQVVPWIPGETLTLSLPCLIPRQCARPPGDLTLPSGQARRLPRLLRLDSWAGCPPASRHKRCSASAAEADPEGAGYNLGEQCAPTPASAGHPAAQAHRRG